MKPSPEIEAIVRRIAAARVDVDTELLLSLRAESDHYVAVSADDSEFLRGIEIAKAHIRANAEVIPLAAVEVSELEAFENGPVGWAAWQEDRTLTDGQRDIVRRTMVFVLEAGAWKIIHTHFSRPVLYTPPEVWTRTLSELLESIEDGADALRGLSGTATFLFTDIVDSTPLSLQLGEKAWHAAITAHLNSLSAAVEDEGGSVVKTLGDGGMFVFESGSAALRAAIAIQRAVTESTDPEMRLRVGVHTGDVLQTEDDFVGPTVAKAARIAAAAAGGQILVSSTTAGMVNASEFEFGRPITVELKGLDGTHQIRPLNWS